MTVVYVLIAFRIIFSIIQFFLNIFRNHILIYDNNQIKTELSY